MKKLTKLLAVLLVFGIIFTGCNNQITSPEPNEIPVETNEETSDNKNELSENEEKTDADKELKEVSAIFYSMEEDKAEMIILDPEVHGNNIILTDEVRVFFSDKKVNTIVNLEIKVKNQSIEVYNAKNTDDAKTRAKYIGFADNNFAEFEMIDKPFMLQIPDELKTDLEKVNTNELLEITIEENEVAIANPILKSFKRGQ